MVSLIEDHYHTIEGRSNGCGFDFDKKRMYSENNFNLDDFDGVLSADRYCKRLVVKTHKTRVTNAMLSFKLVNHCKVNG